MESRLEKMESRLEEIEKKLEKIDKGMTDMQVMAKKLDALEENVSFLVNLKRKKLAHTKRKEKLDGLERRFVGKHTMYDEKLAQTKRKGEYPNIANQQESRIPKPTEIIGEEIYPFIPNLEEKMARLELRLAGKHTMYDEKLAQTKRKGGYPNQQESSRIPKPTETNGEEIFPYCIPNFEEKMARLKRRLLEWHAIDCRCLDCR